MRKSAILVLAFVIAIGFAAAALSAGPTGKITIKLTGQKNAVFDHGAHAKAAESCQKCHHKDAAGKESKCTNCHTATGVNGAVPGKDAFHKQCIGCHKAKDQGPKTCPACHP